MPQHFFFFFFILFLFFFFSFFVLNVLCQKTFFFAGGPRPFGAPSPRKRRLSVQEFEPPVHGLCFGLFVYIFYYFYYFLREDT